MEVTRDPRSVLVDYEARTRLEWIEEQIPSEEIKEDPDNSCEKFEKGVVGKKPCVKEECFC